jgi:ATP-binding cassette subfamily C protein CydC
MSALCSILRVGRRQWGWMLAGILLGVVVIAANSLLMALSGWFIASMALSGASGAAFDYFLPSAGIRALAILRTLGRYGERLVTHEATFRFLTSLRVWLFQRLEPLAPAGLERYASGDVAGRLRGDVDSLENIYLRIIAPLATGGASILLAVLFVSLWDRSSALVLCAVLLCAGVLLPLLGRRLALEPGQNAARLGGELRAAVTEGLLGAEELILLGCVQRQVARVNDISARLTAEQKRLGAINALTLAGASVCGGLGMAGVLAVAGAAVTNGTISGPALVMLLLFCGAALEAAAPLPVALQLAPGVAEALRRIRQLTDAPEPVPEPPRPRQQPAATDIAFRDVSCSPVAGPPLLRGFSLHVPAGSRVGLMGPSGCGKSTVMALLLRFRDYAGSIAVGGVELRDLAGDEARRLFSALPQQPYLFNATIRENILLARPEASEEELLAVLADSGLERWVAGLPLGLDTQVGEGACAVSGGEARRIALARALLKDAPVLLLDEPTEGLDLETEEVVVARLAERTRGKTVLLATHRPTCLALADRVVQMPGVPENRS